MLRDQVRTDSAIAIVGMGCRFPQADGTAAYWRLLSGNVDAITEIPGDRFDVGPFYDPAPGTPGKTVSRHGGFLDAPFAFDSAFFGVTPLEAQGMDPQQRLLLQVVWEALEEAGIPPSTLAGSRTGVFVGQATAEYAEVFPQSQDDVRAAAGSKLRAVTAGRVSYALDLRGPAIVLDTACSSSLVAVHSARQSLVLGESDLAIVAGVNLILSCTDAVAYSQGAMLAPDGRCKFGDATGDGFVRSEGVGVVVLKRLAEAERDGDPIVALLLGSAAVNDGKGSGLLLQPAADGQAATIREACRTAGVSPEQLDYVEAHGTGTPVGDEVELRGLAMAVGNGSPRRRRRLRVGSVKSNIGHLEAGAGIAGIIKAALVARHRTIPASLHVRSPHPLLAEGELPIEVVRGNQALDPQADRALLGVSSFGLSGTNAHAVIGEYPAASHPPWAEEPEPGEDDDLQLLVLTARSPRTLRELARTYADYLAPGGAGRRLPLRKVCAAAALHRDHHPFRLWAAARSADDMVARLRTLADGGETPDGGLGDGVFEQRKRTVFVFPGQGSQWLGMGRELLRTSPAFRAAIESCDEVVRAESGWSILRALTEDGPEMLDDIEIVQPLLWAMQVGMAGAWRERGVEPDLCIGHSMGEAAAAHVAGALSLRDSAAVICRRSRLMKRLAGRGAMLAVGLSAEAARQTIADHAGGGDSVCVAAENSPDSSVLAGDAAILADIAAALTAKGVLAREVKVSVASHSPDMDLIRDDLLTALADLDPAKAEVPLLSTVRCAPVQGRELDAAYWADNLRMPVRFAEAVQFAAKQQESVFIEISPHPLLTAAVEATQASVGVEELAVPTLLREQDERTAMARSLGQVFAHGGRVDWARWFGGDPGHVPLPTYTWDETAYRYPAASPRPASAPDHRRTRDVVLRSWDSRVSMYGLTPIPFVAYLQAALDTARDFYGGEFTLEDVRATGRPVQFDDACEVTLRVTTADEADGGRSVAVRVIREVDGRELELPCIEGRLRPSDAEAASLPGGVLDAALVRCREHLGASGFQALAAHWGYRVDEGLLKVERLWRRKGEAAALLRMTDLDLDQGLEAALLPLLAALPQRHAGMRLYTPETFGSVRLPTDLPGEVWSLVQIRKDRRRRSVADILLLDTDGRVVAELQGIGLRMYAVEEGRRGLDLRALTRRSRRPAESVTPVPPEPPQPATRLPEAIPARRTGGREAVLHNAAAVMGTAPTDINVKRPLRDQGLDSLMALKLNKRLTAATGVDVPVGRLLGVESVATLTRDLFDAGAALHATPVHREPSCVTSHRA